MTRAAIAVLALGGNSLIASDLSGPYRDQLRYARRAARCIVALVREGYRVVVVPGGAPQVERGLIRSEEASTKLPPLPLDACIAGSQGEIGYLLDLEIRNELKRTQLHWPVTTLLTYTLVGLDDPAFQNPQLALGPEYTEWRARYLLRQNEMALHEQAPQRWQRLVPTPRPIEIVNLASIEALLEAKHIVIAAGNGGIPVALDGRGQLMGVEAFVDKDRSAALMAVDLGAELLILLSDLDQLHTDTNRPTERPIERITAGDLRQLLTDGHFPPDSTGPMVEAALEFVEDGGMSALITSPDKLIAALADRAGTRLTRAVSDAPIRRQMALFPSEPSLFSEDSDL